HPDVVRDIDALRHDQRSLVRTAPARILAGLLARRLGDAGPVTLVPCDNVPGNGAVLADALRQLAEAVDPTVVDWILTQVATATTMVDRITPEPTDSDRAAVLEGTGVDDRC